VGREGITGGAQGEKILFISKPLLKTSHITKVQSKQT